jgi:GNAT superfamily N-acetyltransferase
MNFASQIVEQIKRGRLLHAVLLRSQRIGLEFRPYFLFANPPHKPDAVPDSEYQYERIDATNVEDVIENFPEKFFVPAQWRQQIAAGDIGLLFRHDGLMVGYIWANLRFCVFRKPLFQLNADQAYIYNTFVIKSYRGKGLAPLMLSALVKELHELGRTDIYSIVEAFNKPAKRYHEHVGARRLELRLLIVLFKRWMFDLRLRKYGEPVHSKRVIRAAG